MIQSLGQFGAALLAALGTLGLFSLAVWLALKTVERILGQDAPPKLGCPLMALAFLVYMAMLSLVFWPSIEALERHSCRGAADFEACMEGPDPNY